MSKYTVWQCDKCGEQVVGENGPDDWVTAEMTSLPRETISARRLWCRQCWNNIKGPYPKVVEKGN